MGVGDRTRSRLHRLPTVSAGQLTRLQGAYYLVGGLWPLVHWRSFVAVAGPKPDRFQTEVASVLFCAAGAGLLAADREARSATASVRVVSGTAAAALVWLDLRYGRDLRTVFRVEAVLEAVFAAGALLRDPGRKATEAPVSPGVR